MLFYNYTKELEQLKADNHCWLDTTYGNDTCPSAELYLEEFDVIARVTMDYPLKADRECLIHPRFIISLWTVWQDTDPDSPYFRDIERNDCVTPYLIGSDSLTELLANFRGMDDTIHSVIEAYNTGACSNG